MKGRKNTKISSPLCGYERLKDETKAIPLVGILFIARKQNGFYGFSSATRPMISR